AEVITNRSVMNPLQGYRAIHYNLEAREFGRAVTLYVLFLIAALKDKCAEQVLPLIDRWRDEPLPPELSVGNRLFARAYQLAAFTKFKLDTAFVLRDIDALLAEATERDGWAIVSLAGQNLRALHARETARLLRYVRQAAELPTVFGPDGREMTFD